MAETTYTREQINDFANRMITFQHMIEDEHLKHIFKVVSVEDYSLLKRIYGHVAAENLVDPIYVKDLGQYLNVKSDRVARIIQHLADNGYLYWELGETGTHIRLSEIGLARIKEQQEIIDDFYYQVITKMGPDKFKALLDGMNEFTDLVKKEADNM